MFNTLFHYPRVLARHRQGPSAQARERYLTHCADLGNFDTEYSLETLLDGDRNRFAGREKESERAKIVFASFWPID